MSLYLYPSEYGMKHDGRLAIYNVRHKKYYDWRPVKKDLPVDISDKEIVENLIDFKFKFQERINNKWVDLENYFYLKKSRFIRQFWTEKISMTDDEIRDILHYFAENNSEKDYEIIKEAMSRTVNYIMKSKLPKFNNLKKYFNAVDKLNIKMPLIWENINIYLKELVEIKEYFHARKLIGVSYLDIKNSITSDSDLSKFINKKINYLTSLKMQLPNILAGLLYSFIEDRNKAYKYIKEAHEYKNNYINDFNLGLGLSTYIYEPVKNQFNNKISFEYQEGLEKRDITFVVSVDEMFLRKYGMQLFYSIIALKKYHFHIHLVSSPEKSKRIVTESQTLFKQMTKFFNAKEQITIPTYSSENIPNDFVNEITYFACARFVNAEKFIEKLESDIITIDADFVINNDLKKMIDAVSKNDVAVTITTGFTSFLPWTRYMGGTLYLKNNENAKYFINNVRDYILSNMDNVNSWTLDQNALCYAYEITKAKNNKCIIGDISKYPRPLSQPPIRRFIES